jgi:excisionase family DNA binding protein
MTDGYYTVSEFAEKVQVKEATVRKHIKSGQLKATKAFNQWYIHKSELDKILPQKLS